MKGMVVSIVALAATVLYLAGWNARPASARTGPGALQAMLETPVIIEGRVTSVTPLPQDEGRPG